jgi:3-deoxy-manno-octulosonate cytidylyltransferase (CMP-KDO synthetase)
MQQAIAIIPARYASARFPGKPLVEINGKSMIMRVYEQAMKATLLKDVYVATDDNRIYDHVVSSGGKAIMTASDHNSGTERCLEAFQILISANKCSTDEIVLNIQGDEPFILPEQIDSLVRLFSKKKVSIATLVKKIDKSEELNNPNYVKVVIGSKMQALYFSRAAVPFVRDAEGDKRLEKTLFYKHIGMYAYRGAVLTAICKLKPSPLELAEKLEQLRWIENGYIIHVETTDHESVAIDSPADLLKVTNNA